MKEAVLFFLRASMYWKEFQKISPRLGVDRQHTAQKIIRKANEKEDLSWLLSDTTMTMGMTFLEAWEAVETISEIEVRGARSQVDDCKRRHDNAQSDVYSACIAVSSAQSQINYLTPKRQKLAEKYFYSAKHCSTPNFLDEVKDIQFDYLGLEYKISGYDITVRIQEGAIPKGQTACLKLGAALCGPFKPSSGKRPISPILWLCPEGDFMLSKPMEIVLPHILTDVTSEDVKKFGIQVSKATHDEFQSPQTEFFFEPYELQDMRFESNKTKTGNYAAVRVTHCCFWCLEANRKDKMSNEEAQQMARKVGYTMHCIEDLQPPRRYSSIMHFRVSFSLINCIKVRNFFSHCILINFLAQ